MNVDLLEYIHRIILYFMLFGFILPQKYAWIHGITFPLVYWHWTKNDGNCILTEMEYKLRGKTLPKGGMNDYPFMRRIFKELGLDFTNEEIKNYVLPYLTVISIISLLRTLRYKIDNAINKIDNQG